MDIENKSLNTNDTSILINGLDYLEKKNDKSETGAPSRATPDIKIPAFNPPVPNRAWTAMKHGADIDDLNAEEKRELYYGRDDIF